MPQKQRRDDGGGNCIVQNADQNVGKAEEKQVEDVEEEVKETGSERTTRRNFKNKKNRMHQGSWQ